MIRVTVHKNLNGIDEEQWNALSQKSSIYYEYGWFKAITPIVDNSIFFCAWDSDRLVGVLPGIVVTDANTHLYHNHRDALFCRNEIDLQDALSQMNHYKMARKLRALSALSRIGDCAWNRKLFPALVFMSPRGYVSDFLFESEAVAKAILKKVSIYSDSHGIKGRAFLWLEQNNGKVSTLLEREGYKKGLGELEFTYPVKYPDVENSLQQLICKRRNRIRQDLKLFREHGLTASVLKGDQVSSSLKQKIIKLLGQHSSTHVDFVSADMIEGFAERLFRNMGSHMHVTAAHCNGELVGCCLAFQKGKRLYPKLVGYSHEYVRKAAVHFNVTYYENMRFACESGLHEIAYGSGDPHAKMMRGCMPQTLNCYYDFNVGVAWNILMEKYLGWVNGFKQKAYKAVGEVRAWKV
jgi:predicted N-acyltransferase